MVFAIHQCELAIGIHVFPHPEIAPTYLPTLALQVVTECWPWYPVSYIRLTLVIYITGGNVYISMLF